jgi:hypothetical protein
LNRFNCQLKQVFNAIFKVAKVSGCAHHGFHR